MAVKNGFLAVFAMLCGVQAWALDNQIPADLSGLNNDSVKNLLKTVALGADQRTYSPASPLGLAIGLDVGVEVTAVSVPSEFAAALSLATGQSVSSVPSVIPVPKFSIQKGFPFRLDASFTYATSKMLLGQEDLFRVWGLGLKWAFVSGGGTKPALAARLFYSNSTLWFMSTRTAAFDVVASKNLYLLEPYVGTGLKYWSGELNIPTNLPAISLLPASVSGSASSVSPHVFVGLALKMFLLKLTAEYDYNTTGISSYGGKVSLSF